MTRPDFELTPNVAAKLEPLADNGGTTPTTAIPADSAAVDAGDPAWSTATDRRGFGRSVGHGGVGAYQFPSGVTSSTFCLPIVPSPQGRLEPKSQLFCEMCFSDNIG